MTVDRLRPTGQRHALASATLLFLGCAIAAWPLGTPRWLVGLFLALAIICGVWWVARTRRPVQAVNPAKPGGLLGLARLARTSPGAVRAYRYVAQTLAPILFLVLTGVIAIALAHRATFDLLNTGGAYCRATPDVKGQSTQIVQTQTKEPGREPDDERLGEAALPLRTDSICHATGLRLVAGRQYRIRIDMNVGADGEWFDKGIRADVAGFSVDNFRHFLASPLKRWWRENWFQPVARIGEVGNYEHVLEPAAPLPVVPFKNCPRPTQPALSLWEAVKDTPLPATAETKAAQLECEARKGIRPNRILISDITANATGELFLYVNDAVLALPGLSNVFYRNNSGTAKITVKRILATVVEP